MFSEHLNRTLTENFAQNSFADVTLVSDDKEAFHAHKFLLSSLSPVFKDLFLSNLNSNPVIYLRGIENEELNVLLQFMYTRKAETSSSRLEKLLKVAQDLKIQQLIEAIETTKHDVVDTVVNAENL